jgi:DNA-binding NarL/FixJ family response regulator
VTAVIEHSSVRPPVSGRSIALVAVQSRAARNAAVRIMRGVGATDVLAATTVAEARRMAGGRPGEISIIEASLSDGSGTGLARELRAAGWRRTVVLATAEDPFTVRAALAAGVTCYLVVNTPEEAATTGGVPAGHPVAPAPGAGHAVVPRQRTGGALSVPAQRRATPYGLSQREIDVLQLVADGQSNREVGEKLGLSALTVKSHLARIARKLGTGDRAEMVIIALRAEVIA